jgi:phosphatidylserine decarboxylase
LRIDSAGFPFISGALALAVLAGAVGGWLPAAPLVLLALFFAFFFRDPERRVPAAASDNDVLSPADGEVLVAGEAMPEAAPPGIVSGASAATVPAGLPGASPATVPASLPASWRQVSIFLSPMDVHVNRVPASGRVTRVLLTRGRFLPAYRREAATVNERSEIWIDHHGQHVVARQIVGILARRVVCRLQEGARVKAGDRLGIMKFGSRMDVFMPANATITVKVGDKVRGGETVIAVLHSR